MSERCKNCDSTDIVSIQGQRFCINCGEPYTGAETATTKVEPTVATSAVKVATKPEPAPAPKPASRKEVTSSAPPLDLRYASKAQPAVARSSSVRGSESAGDSKPAKAESAQNLHRPEVVGASQPHPWGFSFRVALWVATPTAALIGAMSWFYLDLDLVIYTAVASAVMGFVALTLAQAALLYGMSRAHDHRPVARSQWWRAARSGLMDAINITLITLIKMVVTVGLAAAAWQWIAQLGLPNWGEIGLLLAVNSVAAWLLLGSVIARHIAIPASVIGGMSSTAAYRLGWRTYLKAGGSLSLALVQAWITRILVLITAVVAAFYLNQYLSDINHTIATLIIAGTTWLFIVLLFVTVLQLEAKVWLRHYRYWIARCFPDRQLRLLAGRVQTMRQR